MSRAGLARANAGRAVAKGIEGGEQMVLAHNRALTLGGGERAPGSDRSTRVVSCQDLRDCLLRLLGTPKYSPISVPTRDLAFQNHVERHKGPTG